MVKNITLALTLLFLTSIVNAQEPCATVMPEHMKTWLKDYKENNIQYHTSGRNLYYIPIQFHIVGEDNGSGYFEHWKVIENLDLLNQQYSATGFYFYLYDEVNYINNSSYYRHNYNSGSEMMLQYNVAEAVNIYIVEDPSGACGYFSGWSDGIAVKKSCFELNNGTLAHEVGHYFSLPHTFSGWEGGSAPSNPEKVDGSNCTYAGDRFCDTPPDYLSYRWNCPSNSTIYAGIVTDSNGDTLQIDGSLFMSYSNDGCMNRFSEEQDDAMIAYLTGQRSYLLNGPEPEIAELDTSKLIYPENEQTDVPANYAYLKWKSVEGADKYKVLIKRYASINFYEYDITTEDTFIILDDLSNNRNYYWKVKPYTNSNVEMDYTQQFRFTTTDEDLDIVPEITVEHITCPSKDYGQISISVNGGTAPYTYEITSDNFNNTYTDSVIHDLPAGFYHITITDDTQNTSTVPFEVHSPDPLQVSFTEGQDITVEVSGGTPPYTYTWSDGTNGSSIPAGNTGDVVSVVITDDKNCSYEKSYTLTPLPKVINNTYSMVIYPNPAHKSLNIDATNSKKTRSVLLRFYDLTGKVVKATNLEMQQGKNHTSVDISKLPGGVYILEINDGENLSRKKVVLY